MASGQSTSNRHARKKRVLPTPPGMCLPHGASGTGGKRATNRTAQMLHGLIQAIGMERGRLCDAQSVLACLYTALLNARRHRVGSEADYAGAAGIALGIVRDTLDRLDAICVSSATSNTPRPTSPRVR